MVDVDCTECGKKIADYTGPLGKDIPIRSMFYKRVDGTQPKHGSSTAWPCPHCGKQINELVCTMNAIMRALPQDPATMRELIQRADPTGAR